VLWAYNGFAYRNHPLTQGTTLNGLLTTASRIRAQLPYQEFDLGCIANPPLRDGAPLWPAQPVTLPDLSDPAFSGPLDPT